MHEDAYTKYETFCTCVNIVPLVQEDYDKTNRPTTPHVSISGLTLETEADYKRRIVKGKEEQDNADALAEAKIKTLSDAVARLSTRVQFAMQAEVEF